MFLDKFILPTSVPRTRKDFSTNPWSPNLAKSCNVQTIRHHSIIFIYIRKLIWRYAANMVGSVVEQGYPVPGGKKYIFALLTGQDKVWGRAQRRGERRFWGGAPTLRRFLQLFRISSGDFGHERRFRISERGGKMENLVTLV